MARTIEDVVAEGLRKLASQTKDDVRRIVDELGLLKGTATDFDLWLHDVFLPYHRSRTIANQTASAKYRSPVHRMRDFTMASQMNGAIWCADDSFGYSKAA